MTPTGIEPATFRFVAQHLNHCCTYVNTFKGYSHTYARNVSEKSFLKLRFNTALTFWSAITSDKLYGILISADETGAQGSRYNVPGPLRSDRGPSSDCFACVFVSLGSIIICLMHKSTLPHQAQVCLQLTVGGRAFVFKSVQISYKNILPVRPCWEARIFFFYREPNPLCADLILIGV